MNDLVVLIVGVLVGIVVAAAVAALVVWLVRRSSTTSKPPSGASPARREDPFNDVNATAGDPRTLKVGDMVDYLDSRFFVRGTLRLREGGFTWAEHFLDDVAGTRRWISVEEDPDLEVVLWTSYQPPAGARLTPDANTLTVEGVEYRREEHGSATYESEGSTGVGSSGRVEYVDYAGPSGRSLGFERFSGGEWECGLGERVPAGTMTIYPSSDGTS